MYYLLRSCIPCHINTQTHIQLLISLENRLIAFVSFVLQWRHNERDGISNHQPDHCLFNNLFKAHIKESIKASRHLPLYREFTGDRLIPCTKGQ